MTCLKRIDLDFTSLQFFDHFVISTVESDTQLEKDHIERLRKICHDFYGYKRFAYLANRKNDYNVNPIIYLNLLERNNLAGIAVISDTVSRLKTANFEKQFSPVPFELFQNAEEAKAWANRLISSE